MHKLVSNLRRGYFGPFGDTLLESINSSLWVSEVWGVYDTFQTLRPCYRFHYVWRILSNFFTFFFNILKTDGFSMSTLISPRPAQRLVQCPPRRRVWDGVNKGSQTTPCASAEEKKAWLSAKLRELCRRGALSPELYTAHSVPVGEASWPPPRSPRPAWKLWVTGRWSDSIPMTLFRLKRYHFLNPTAVSTLK